MLLRALNTARDLGRLHEIASVLVRHGLGDVVRRVGLAGLLERAGKALHWRVAQGIGHTSTEQHFREALEDLGPTFVKVGQLLAGRSDLLPPEWTEELSRLQERATPVPFEEIRAQLEEDLGAPPDTIFDDLDPEPLAAASIAQVHAARLHDGDEVVLKVRRPGIADVVEADLRLLARLAESIDRGMPELRRYRPRSLARQFSASLRRELDLGAEARAAERMRASLPEDGGVIVPAVHRRWSGQRLCVMERLRGTSLGAWIREGKPGPHDPRVLAGRGADAVLHMVFEDGFYHADPHPGNVVLLDDGRLGLLDFGMVGHLSETRRTEFLEVLLAIAERQSEEMAEILLGWSPGGKVDVDMLTTDCAAFADRYEGAPVSQVDVRALLFDIGTILRENDLFLPHDVAMLLKVFVTLDSLGRALDPSFVTSRHIEPFAKSALRRNRSPFRVARRTLREGTRLLAGLPRDVRRLLRAARRGHIRFDIGMDDLHAFGNQLDRSANRVTVGLVTAALIVGTSIALTVSGGPTLLGLPLFGMLGFVSSIAGGVWLLWSILRSRRS